MEGIDRRRLKIIREWRSLSSLSFRVFREAKEVGDLDAYLSAMNAMTGRHQQLYSPSCSWVWGTGEEGFGSLAWVGGAPRAAAMPPTSRVYEEVIRKLTKESESPSLRTVRNGL